MKAARPSAASAVAKQIVCRSRSYSIALSIGLETAALRLALAVSAAIGAREDVGFVADVLREQGARTSGAYTIPA